MKYLRLILILPFLLLVAAKIPEATGYVTDLAGVIAPQTSASITSLITELEQKTGAEIAVLTVNTTEGEDIFDYSMAVADKWKVGKKGKDNGVLMVFAINNRKMHILVGYGLEGILNDAKVGRIEDQYIVPSFKQNDYSKGIQNGVQAIAQVIAQDAGVTLTGISALPQEPQPQSVQLSNKELIKYLVVLIILVMVFGRWFFLPLFFLGGRRSFGGFGGGGFGGGGFGGFGGGGFGGGGAGRGW